MKSSELPNFHDGYLQGIQLNDKTAKLSLERVDGKRYELTLHMVQALKMDDFLQGNIIAQCYVIQGETPHPEYLQRLFPDLHPSVAPKYQEANARVRSGHTASVEQGAMAIVAIIPSYGAEFVALCESVTLKSTREILPEQRGRRVS